MAEGINNSKFFSVVINQRRNSSQIEFMRLENGNSLANLDEIHDTAINHFQAFLFDYMPRDVPDLCNLISAELTTKEDAKLVKTPSKAELKLALSSILKDNSPWPDCFGSRFYIACFILDGSIY